MYQVFSVVIREKDIRNTQFFFINLAIFYYVLFLNFIFCFLLFLFLSFNFLIPSYFLIRNNSFELAIGDPKIERITL